MSISAGGNEMHPYAAFIVGFIAGSTYIAWDIVLLHIKVDDPVTATSGRLKWFDISFSDNVHRYSLMNIGIKKIVCLAWKNV